MGTQTNLQGRPQAKLITPDLIEWQTLSKLLTYKDYERVAALIEKTLAACESENDPVVTAVWSAAHQICLSCRQIYAEIDWHQQAHEDAVAREGELRQQLELILTQAMAYAEPAGEGEFVRKQLDEQEVEEEKGRTLWQRVRTLFGRETSYPAQPQAPVVFAKPVVRETAVPPDVNQQEKNSPSLAVYCLGPFRVYQDDQLISDWSGLKGKLIFKYLVTHVGKPIAKDILMDVFWPDADPEATRRNLHQAIYSLRQVLRQGYPDFQHIQFENDCYLLNPKMVIWIDSDEFQKHVQTGRRLEADGQIAQAMAEYGVAEGLYQSDFLEDDLYEEWTRSQREHMRVLYVDITNRLSAYYVQQGEHTAAIALCQKALAQDNCYEDAHLRLMECYLAQGQRHLAVQQYQTCAQLLKEELNLNPSEKTEALFQHITR